MPNLIAFITYIFVVSFTPGPNTILCMATASQYGFKKTLRLSLGIGSGFFMVMLLSMYFNIALYQILPTVKAYMSFIGAGYMMFLAYKIFKSRPPQHVKKDEIDKEDKETEIDKETDKDKEDKDEEGKGYDGEKIEEDKGQMKNLYMTGLTMQFFNPKGIIYGITVASSFIIPYYHSNLIYILFALLLSGVALTSTAVWASFGAVFSRFLYKYHKQFNVIMSLLLVYSALSILGWVHF